VLLAADGCSGGGHGVVVLVVLAAAAAVVQKTFLSCIRKSVAS
jgi:hypothetical protein